MVAALRAAGAPEEILKIAQGQSVERASDFEVWEENAQIFEVFLVLGTCWTLAVPAFGAPVPLGIPAAEIESTLRLLGFAQKKRAKALRDIRQMERAALSVFYE